ncbi:MAG: hypothetical protein PHG65_05725 [Kiritimatiellae bacterium]|nr:hypothetical protein [Kiritimatiellia bacterium]
MNVIDIVNQIGPCAASTLIEALVEKTNCSNDAARQRISRAVTEGGVRYLGKVLLSSGARVYYTGEQSMGDDWEQKFLKVFKEDGSAYRHILNHLFKSDRCVNVKRAESLCGFPVKRRKGHLEWGTALENLLRENIVCISEDANYGQHIDIQPVSPKLLRLSFARFRTEQILALSIKDFLRRNGLVAYDRVKVRHDGEDAEFGGYAWDITAPTYILPYASMTKNEKMGPGFWVVDCMLGRKMDEQDIAWFLEKISAMKTQKQVRPFTAMLVADGFEKKAFDLGRQAGAILTTPQNLFGEGTAKVLSLFMEILSDPGVVAKTDPEQIICISEQLSSMEGLIGNLRGDLFEFLVGVAVLAEKQGNISVKRELRINGKAITDIDVEIVATSSVTVIECKGYHREKQVGLGEVRDWFRNNVPAIRKLRKGVFDGEKETYAFWTSGVFDSSAIKFLQEHKEACKKYGVEWKDGSEIREYLRKHKQARLLQVLNRISKKVEGDAVK